MKQRSLDQMANSLLLVLGILLIMVAPACYFDPGGMVQSSMDSRCKDDDGVCHDRCNASTDNDCPAVCGNNVIEPGETCDPPGSCPMAGECSDGYTCSTDTLVGSAETCDAECVSENITTCNDNDGCCLPQCDISNDADCWDPDAKPKGPGTGPGNTMDLDNFCLEEMIGWCGPG